MIASNIQKLLRRFKTNNPFEIAEGLNIEVIFADLGESTRGLYYKKLRRRYIVIHCNLSEDWQRFICAHELGHDRLHPGVSRFWLDERSFHNSGKYERQANKFAVHLLTSSDIPIQDESIAEFLQRHHVPKEMEIFY